MGKLVFLILLIITFGCSRNNTEEPGIEECTVCNEGVCTEEKYEFPENWMQLATTSERHKALQIPDACLEILSTKGLLETCLEFPGMPEISFYNDYQTGFNALVKVFNGYRELLQRPDLVNVLIEKYAVIGVEVPEIQSQSNLEKGTFSYGFLVLEFILAQDLVIENLNKEQEKIVVLLSFEYKELKDSYPEIFSGGHDMPSHLLYAKILINDPDFEFESDEQKYEILGFIQSPHSLIQQTIDYIENYIYEKYKK